MSVVSEPAEMPTEAVVIVGEAEGSAAAAAMLDAPNRAIIEALQRDGRQPYGAIAEEVGLSEAAVRRRVQRLRAT